MSEKPSNPANRRAHAERVMASLPPELRDQRFDLVDYREPSAKALKVAKELQGRGRRAT